jgi:uncharacterized repeat protein (TIGR03806 family)
MGKWWILFVIFVACSAPKKQQAIEEVSLGVTQHSDYPQWLSEWKFFQGEIRQLVPAEQVMAYDINSPLFSDFAHKARFIYLPAGTQMTYHTTEAFNFPKGAVLIKNFYYPADFRKPEAERRILETRLLINEPEGWWAIAYQWNAEQTDAMRIVLGAEVPVVWTDETGKLQRINYSIPSQPQCKSCHDLNGQRMPIGPTARQLNKGDQLQKWDQQGLIAEFPTGAIPQLVDYSNKDATLNDRARAWLEINCAHCHRREGPAKNSGLYLLTSETEAYRLGVNKPPIAAGKGSAGMKYSIVPGHPDQSIILHRIASLEPGEMMPELGRKMQHKEGIELIEEWILAMDK